MDQANPISVGLVGVGTMGGAMARALIAAGQALRAHDIRPEKIDPYEGPLLRRASSAAEIANSGTDVVLLSLPGPDDVEAAVMGADGLLRAAVKPSVVVDLSTVDPATSRRMAAAAERMGVGYLDAPVLGRPDRVGAWTLPVGGPEATIEQVRPLLGHLAKQVVPVGPTGAGNAIKLLNNLMFGAVNAITVECLVAARRIGMDPSVFVETVATSNAASVSNLFIENGPKIVAGDVRAAFSLDLLVKDNRLALDMLQEVGMAPIVARSVDLLGRLGQGIGLGDLDTSALTRVYDVLSSPSAKA
ncbi:MAG: NAD(P)-dependent oxidoreductase [Acidimicrobiales bacterium]